MSVETWVTNLTPEPFREFLPYTSLAALKVIHVADVLGKAAQVARHYAGENERVREAERLRRSLRAAGFGDELSVADRPPAKPLAAEWGEVSQRLIGERLLGLYFHLLSWDGPLFLDLRPRQLAWDQENQRLCFFPSSLWYRPDEEFMSRIRALYAGFYRGDGAALARGVELYSWRSQPRAGFPQRLDRLLRDHFGAGGTDDMRFSIAHFRETFERIFAEAAASGAKLHPDLPFLGVELVGLYLTLESLAVSLNPRRAFEAAQAG